MTDLQKQRLYNAERVLRDHPTKFRTQEQIERYVSEVTGSDTWKAMNGPAVVRVRIKRSDSNHSHAIGNEIALCPNQCDKVTVIHELAHVVSSDGHGPQYAGRYLQLVEEFIGRSWAKSLRKSMEEHRVAYTPDSRVLSYQQAAAAERASCAPLKPHSQETADWLALIGLK